MKQEQHLEFDFKKIISEPIKKIERQSYKKVMFLAIGICVFTTLGLGIKDSINNHFTLSNAIDAKKTALSLQEIKSMSATDFDSMLSHIMKQSNIYDEKVHFIQSIVAKAEIESYGNSMSAEQASSLGESLDSYKDQLLQDTSQLSLIRRNVLNDLPITSEEADLFFKYQTAYKTKSLIRSKQLEDNMQNLLYSKNVGNNKYNAKYNIYDTIKAYDQKINNSLNTIDIQQPAIKPKI